MKAEIKKRKRLETSNNEGQRVVCTLIALSYARNEKDNSCRKCLALNSRWKSR